MREELAKHNLHSGGIDAIISQTKQDPTALEKPFMRRFLIANLQQAARTIDAAQERHL